MILTRSTFANSVALKLGRAAEGCPKAAELLKAASAEEERLSAQRKVRPQAADIDMKLNIKKKNEIVNR